MKGSVAVIEMLNERLAAEHAGIVQYVTHGAMCVNWGYEKLAKYILGRAKEEMKHAGMLLDRILFLEGIPTLINVGAVEIATDVTGMFLCDQKQEISAIEGYTEAIDIAVQYKDFTTRKLMELILEDENDHENVIESNLQQISDVGLANYLPVNIEG